MTKVVVGVGGIFGHDSAVSIVRDGLCEGMIEEERLIRQKRAVNAVPINALRGAIRAWSNPNDDVVYAVPWSHCNVNSSSYLLRLSKKGITIDPARVHYIDHHLSHAAYALSTTQLERGGFLVVDGHSENKSITIGEFIGDSFKIITEYGIPASPGHFFESVANHLGFGYDGTGKLMGLASYCVSDPNEFGFLDQLMDGLNNSKGGEKDDYRNICRNTLAEWDSHLCKITQKNNTADYSWLERSSGANNIYLRIASSAQLAFEKIILYLLKEVIGYSGFKDIIYSGGAALNCQANARIEEELQNIKLHVAPASGDSGTAIGAALIASGSVNLGQRSPYLGLEYEIDHIRNYLKECGIRHLEMNSIYEKAAELIKNGDVVARFSGRAEIGPRALGNRSILARPDSKRIRNKVNIIKRRELWRPLAPALLERNYEKYFPNSDKNIYMLKAIRQDNAWPEYSGTIHVDKTARVQVTNKELNSGFHSMLQLLDDLEIRGVINTSFNDELEPIVSSPRDAIRTFFSTGIDHLILADTFLISK